MTTEADKIVAELMAQIQALCALSWNEGRTGVAVATDEWGAKLSSVEQAIRRAVDWKLVACVVEPMHGNNGITWGREAHLNPPPVGTPLYARSQA